MAYGYSSRTSALFIIAIFLIQLVLISDHLKPVSGDKRLLKKLKKVGALLYLIKSKKPKLGILPIPLPLPIPLKISKDSLGGLGGLLGGMGGGFGGFGGGKGGGGGGHHIVHAEPWPEAEWGYAEPEFGHGFGGGFGGGFGHY